MERTTAVRLAGAALVGALLVGGCGGTGATTSEAGGSDTSTSAGPTSTSTSTSQPVSTSTTQPTRKLRSTPDCTAVYRLNLALFFPAFAPEDKRSELIDLLNRQVNATREQVPQFGEAINAQVLALRKDLAGTATNDDKAKAEAAQQQMADWYEQNCVEDIGGGPATTSASSTTKAAAQTTTTSTTRAAAPTSTPSTTRPVSTTATTTRR